MDNITIEEGIALTFFILAGLAILYKVLFGKSDDDVHYV
jgi:hypothetical protein